MLNMKSVFDLQQERLKMLPCAERITKENENNTALLYVLAGVAVFSSIILYCVIGLGWVL